MAYIGCRNCESPDCKGCNLKNLETMLNNGKFDCMMNANRCINPAADVEYGGRLRGVTYEDGKVTAVHIRDTDDAVKVFAPVRHGKWLHHIMIDGHIHAECSECHKVRVIDNYCPNCGAKMDGGEGNA